MKINTKGLFYFLGHDEVVPRFMRDEMLKWGYPKDEYVDNGHWTHQLYVREARRMVGELVMTEYHCVGREVVDDVIGWAAYTMDSHNCDRLVVDGWCQERGECRDSRFPALSHLLPGACTQAARGDQPVGAGMLVGLAYSLWLDSHGAGLHGVGPVGRRGCRVCRLTRVSTCKMSMWPGYRKS